MKKLKDNFFAFEYEAMNTRCFVIFSEHFVFIIDTFLGPDSIMDMYNFVMESKGNREIVIINTHWHYDHIWGNCLFYPCRIIAHEKCRDLMKEKAQNVLEDFLEKEPSMVSGNVKIILPDTVFSDSMEIYDGDFSIRLENFSGHSSDSIIIIVKPLNICIAGDSLEDPFPLIHEVKNGADILLNGLKRIKHMEFDNVYPSHGHRLDKSLIDDNIFYLEDLVLYKTTRNLDFEDYCKMHEISDSFYIDSHMENIKFLDR